MLLEWCKTIAEGLRDYHRPVEGCSYDCHPEQRDQDNVGVSPAEISGVDSYVCEVLGTRYLKCPTQLHG